MKYKSKREQLRHTFKPLDYFMFRGLGFFGTLRAWWQQRHYADFDL